MNYPNGNTKTNINKNISVSRGQSLEKEINITNKYYLDNNIANIHKKPTPITITGVDYPQRNRAKITEAFFRLPSTTDYNGIFKAKYIDFEVKECRSKTSFPFSSFHIHQIKHLESVLYHGAIAFVVIKMCQYDIAYLIDAKIFINEYKTSLKKSVSYKWIKENGHQIPSSYIKPCDYLTVVCKLYNL